MTAAMLYFSILIIWAFTRAIVRLFLFGLQRPAKMVDAERSSKKIWSQNKQFFDNKKCFNENFVFVQTDDKFRLWQVTSDVQSHQSRLYKQKFFFKNIWCPIKNNFNVSLLTFCVLSYQTFSFCITLLKTLNILRKYLAFNENLVE